MLIIFVTEHTVATSTPMFGHCIDGFETTPREYRRLKDLVPISRSLDVVAVNFHERVRVVANGNRVGEWSITLTCMCT